MKFNLYRFTRKQHACALVFCPANAFIRSPQGFTFSTFARLPHRRRLHCKSNPTSLHYPRKESQKKKDDYHSTLKALNSKGRFPRKSLGQHYMWNASINEELAAAANVKEGDIVLEIGPGTGSLTKDPHMAVLVRERFAGVGRVKVVEEDFAKSHIWSHISSLLPSESPPVGKSFFAKDEAALRLLGSSISSHYRPVNNFVNFYSDPEYIAKVSRTNFFPQPKVDAAVISFKLKQTEDYPHVSSIRSFFLMVNSAFTDGKRKMLRKSLQHMCSPPDIEAALCVMPVFQLLRDQKSSH